MLKALRAAGAVSVLTFSIKSKQHKEDDQFGFERIDND